MARRLLRFAVPVLVASAALSATAPALAHEGDPNYRSDIDPPPPAISARMVNYDDTLELTVEPGHEVLVRGYEGEPYVRFRTDGTVEVNRRAPSHYLNEDRYAEVDVPAAADPEAEPRWEEVASHGRYGWHDHRVHYMSKALPPQVTDDSAVTKIFDWEVPIEVDGRPQRLTGTLWWDPVDEGGVSLGLVGGLGAVVLASLGLAVWRIRARGRDDENDGAPGEEREAW